MLQCHTESRVLSPHSLIYSYHRCSGHANRRRRGEEQVPTNVFNMWDVTPLWRERRAASPSDNPPAGLDQLEFPVTEEPTGSLIALPPALCDLSSLPLPAVGLAASFHLLHPPVPVSRCGSAKPLSQHELPTSPCKSWGSNEPPGHAIPPCCSQRRGDDRAEFWA